eukprot:2438701-Prymnesium_polylepis.1
MRRERWERERRTRRPCEPQQLVLVPARLRSRARTSSTRTSSTAPLQVQPRGHCFLSLLSRDALDGRRA